MSFKDTVGLELLSTDIDYAEMAIEFNDKLKNIYGFFHGGVYFSLADHTAGLAAISNGESYVTVNASISYMVAVNEGKLVSKARVINRSGKLAIVDVEIFSGEQLVNKCTFTMYKVRKTSK